MQGFILTSITAAEKYTLIFDSKYNFDKESRAGNVGQGHLVMVHA